jgi:NADPH-dependent 2,4-dienoyl-CoA reductase/sulfur reductase-like enzyme
MKTPGVDELAGHYDVVVIGGGPAGLAAATLAGRQGVSVLVIDENPSVGGQIYRAITTTPLRDERILHADYWRGRRLAADFAAAPVAYLPSAFVWSVSRNEADGLIELGLSREGQARLITASQCILATGALERPCPVPGWTLPGVMTAGAAQTALKTSGLVPDGRIVLAGSGPLLYLLAWQVLTAGGHLSAVLETTPPANRTAALRHALGFLTSPYFAKGLRLLWSVRRLVPVVSGVREIALEGTDHVERVRYRRSDGRGEAVEVDGVLLHLGVVPNINLSRAAGCEQSWDPLRLCWTPNTDDTLQSSLAGVAIAGDGAGVNGAEAATVQGRIAALGALHRLGRIDLAERDSRLAEERRALVPVMRGRAFLDRLYQPAKAFRIPREAATIVCRCEEVTAGQIRDTIAAGCQGPNQLKSFLRCGMGPCQGRLCHSTVSEVMADSLGRSPAEIGSFRLRPPVKPVTLREIAAMPTTEEAIRVVGHQP